MVERFRYFHLTDHAQLVRLCMLTLERAYPNNFRWFQETVSNGNEIGSLAGRSMRLGDSFSRNRSIEMRCGAPWRLATGICGR